MRPARRTLVIWAAITVVMIAAFVWSGQNAVTVHVRADDTRLEAEVNGIRSIHMVAASPGGEQRIALFLNGPGYPPSPRDLEDATWFERTEERVLSAVRAIDADTAWSDVRLSRPDARLDQVVDWSPSSDSRWLGGPESGWSSGTGGFLVSQPLPSGPIELRGTLVGEADQAGVVVHATESGEGQLFLFRPLHQDAMWFELRDGLWYGPHDGIVFTRPWDSLLRKVVRLITRAYLVGLVLAGIATTAALVVTITVTSARRLAFRPQRQLVAPVGGAGRLPKIAPNQPGDSVRARSWSVGDVSLGTGIAAIALVGFVSTAYIASNILERLPHVQDSVGYLFQAKTFALGRLWVPLPELPEFFVHEFIVMHDGRWFSKYPPGFPLLLTVGVLAGAPWLVNPVLAAIALILTFLVGRQVAGPGTGILAATLLLTSPFFLFLSGSFMAHTAGLAAALLFAYLFFRSEDRRGVAWPLLTGVALGVGLLIRPWTAIVVAIPFGLAALIRLLRGRTIADARFLLIGVGAAPFLIGWLWYNDQLTGDPFKNTMELWWSFDRLGFGPDKGIQGHSPGNGLYNLNRNLTELVRHAFGWPTFATLALALIPFVTVRARRRDWLLLAAILSLWTGYFFWWADGIMFGPRFYFEVMGFVAILSARGVSEAAGWATSLPRRATSAGPVRAIATTGPMLLVLAFLLYHNLAYYLPTQLALHRGYNFVNRGPVNAVERAGVHNAVVFVDVGQPHEWWNYGMVFSSNDPLLEGDVIYARDLGPERNARLMDLYPGREYYRLRGTALQRVGSARE